MVLRIILLFGSGFTRNFSIGLFSTSKTADADRLLPVRSTFLLLIQVLPEHKISSKVVIMLVYWWVSLLYPSFFDTSENIRYDDILSGNSKM